VLAAYAASEIAHLYAASSHWWSRVWADAHRSASKGGYAPTLFTMSDTNVRENPFLGTWVK
jgi:hypothetical protein